MLAYYCSPTATLLPLPPPLKNNCWLQKKKHTHTHKNRRAQSKNDIKKTKKK
jgi:hypothetical protein